MMCMIWKYNRFDRNVHYLWNVENKSKLHSYTHSGTVVIKWLSKYIDWSSIWTNFKIVAFKMCNEVMHLFFTYFTDFQVNFFYWFNRNSNILRMDKFSNPIKQTYGKKIHKLVHLRCFQVNKIWIKKSLFHTTPTLSSLCWFKFRICNFYRQFVMNVNLIFSRTNSINIVNT